MCKSVKELIIKYKGQITELEIDQKNLAKRHERAGDQIETLAGVIDNLKGLIKE